MKKPGLFVYLIAILSFIACEEEDNLNKLPGKPVLLSPENGTVIDINSITFKWEESTDPEDDDVFYTLFLSNDTINWSSYSDIFKTELTINDSAAFQEGEQYFWKVKAENVFYFETPAQEPGESISKINYFYAYPPGVKNLKDTSGHEFVTLYWNDPSDLDYVEITFEPHFSSIDQPIQVSPGIEKLELTGLENSTLYTIYIKAYSNKGLSSKTDTIKALPLDPTQVHDADFNIYNITKIGTQTWLTENLRTTRWQDGTTMPVNYYKIGEYSDIYGYHYYPNTAFGEGSEGKNPCPCGYHVPSDDEWKELERFLGMPEDEVNRFSTNTSDFYRAEGLLLADALKTTSGWLDYNGENANGADIYRFNLLPAGYFWGDYYDAGVLTILYSSTIQFNYSYISRIFSNESDGIGRYSYDTVYGSVRCIKD